MRLVFKKIEAKNFRKYESFEQEFGETVKISGTNGEGKSTIALMVSYNLFGTDTMGGTFEPLPEGEYDGDTFVKLLLEKDGDQYEFVRSIEKGKNKFYINEVPKKAGEYDAAVKAMFTKEMFLTIWNPAFFPSQHKKDQRSQLLQFIDEPFDKEVFEVMDKKSVKALEPALKKHTLNELHKLHNERYKQRDTEYTRLTTRLATLEEQLQKFTGTDRFSLDDVEKDFKEANNELIQARGHNSEIIAKNRKLADLKRNKEGMVAEVAKKQELLKFLKEQSESAVCESCGQEVVGDAFHVHEEKMLKRIESVKQEGKDLVGHIAEVIKQIESWEAPEPEIDTDKLEAEVNRMRSILMNSKQLQEMMEDVEHTKQDKEKARLERIESLNIVEAIKIFVEKKAELQVQKVNGLFVNLSVKLFEQQKNGALKQTFELEMDGKPYSKLSTAEKIVAGLELIEVLQSQADIQLPTFVDNAESIIHMKPPTGQLLFATVKDAPLAIETIKTEVPA